MKSGCKTQTRRTRTKDLKPLVFPVCPVSLG